MEVSGLNRLLALANGLGIRSTRIEPTPDPRPSLEAREERATTAVRRAEDEDLRVTLSHRASQLARNDRGSTGTISETTVPPTLETANNPSIEIASARSRPTAGTSRKSVIAAYQRVETQPPRRAFRVIV